MRAVVITPGKKDSDRLVDVADPTPRAGEALVQVLSVGVDGTDDELVSGEYGEAPEGEDHLIIGHESLGRVVEAAGGLRAGQLVAAIVRRPDPVPCLNCSNDEWDYCLNGQYTERGIKGRHGSHIGLINAALRLQNTSLRSTSRTLASAQPETDGGPGAPARTGIEAADER